MAGPPYHGCRRPYLAAPYGTLEISQIQAEPKMCSAHKKSHYLDIFEADFALLPSFVLYVQKINNGVVFLSASGPALTRGAGFGWRTPPGPATDLSAEPKQAWEAAPVFKVRTDVRHGAKTFVTMVSAMC